jgi:hypothetical protein
VSFVVRAGRVTHLTVETPCPDTERRFRVRCPFFRRVRPAADRRLPIFGEAELHDLFYESNAGVLKDAALHLFGECQDV